MLIVDPRKRSQRTWTVSGRVSKKDLALRKTALESTLPPHNDGAGHRVSERIEPSFHAQSEFLYADLLARPSRVRDESGPILLRWCAIHRFQHVTDSSDRDAGVSFFDTPVLFPERFSLTLDRGRHVVVDRKRDKKQDLPTKTEGRWLVPGAGGYIKVPTFRGGVDDSLYASGNPRALHQAIEALGSLGTCVL